jgi:hypothetical protein
MSNGEPDYGLGSIACCMAGAAAERLFFGAGVETGDAIDRKRAAEFMRMSGMDAAAVTEIRGIVERTVAAHRERIKFIADNLLVRGTLRGAEIERML